MLKVRLKIFTLLFGLICFFYFSSSAQIIGNEWINYNQFYYKFPVTQTGIYRITPSALAASGANFSNVNPRNFQIYGRGKEIPIYVKGENDLDGIFNNNDYIEFYAQRNDAWLDSLVYDNPQHLTNPFYSLFTDTAYYFLTWNNSFSNLRMSIDVSDTSNASLYSPEPFFMQERLHYFNNSYYQGESDATKITDPEYTDGEGWMGNSFNAGSSQTINLKTDNLYINGPPSFIKTTFSAWTNDFIFHPNNRVKASINNLTLLDSTFIGYKTFHPTFTIPNNQILNANSNFLLESIAVPGAYNPQSLALSFVQLYYPRTFNVNNEDSVYINIPNTILQNKTRIELTGLNATSPAFLYDLNDNRRITAIKDGALHRFVFPNFNKNFQGYITSESHIFSVTNIIPVTPSGKFTNYASQLPAQPDYIIVTGKKLESEAIAYKNYRSSSTGGLHKVRIALVEELYDQYAYGIKRNPIALRQFSRDALKNWANNVQYLFLLGKGISAADLGHESFRNDPSILSQNIVPSFGVPPSDNLITNHIKDSLLFAPAIPTGRLAASNSQDVINYLDKVQQYESAPREIWMKNVLHFGGGTSLSEQQQFAFNLDTYKSILEDTAFGGSVYTFLKNTSAPIQITLSDSVKQLIETGASIMTFFGHASGSSFDQSIDQPEAYNNVGKYPIVVANSCYSGNIHNPIGTGESRINEDYVLYPNGGAIAFIAQVGQGISQFLHNYSTSFFRQVGSLNYGKPMSHAMKKTVQSIQANYLYMKALCLEMTLHGDPALVLNSFAKPDYQIKTEQVAFSSGIAGVNNISASLDSFFVQVKVVNAGRATADSSLLQLKRIFPGNAAPVTIDTVISGIHLDKTIQFKFPIDRANGIGLNKFEITVDAGNRIDELNETTNNNAVAELNIISGFISPVYPYNFAVIPNDTVTLLASTFDPLAPVAKYFFELDTNDRFNSSSPMFKSTSIVSSGGLLSWKVPMVLQDSMVYFWRVSRDTTGTGQGQFWKQSSFQFIRGKSGWSQAHFDQFKNDGFSFLKQNFNSRKFELDSARRSLFCKTFGQPTISDDFETSYSIDGQIQESASCGGGFKIHVAVIDKLTLEPWRTRFIDTTSVPATISNPRHYFGNGNDNNYGDVCPNRYGPAPLFVFWTNRPDNMLGLTRMLRDSLRNDTGSYILAYTWEAPRPGWANKDSVFNAFSAIGFDSLRYVYDSRPWIYFAKIGDPSSVKVIIGDTGHVEINLSAVIRSNRKSGEITSSIIGPAASWESLHWHSWSVEQPTNDKIRTKIFGIKSNGQESLIIDSVNVFKASMNLQSRINAAQYPFLKINQFTEDDVSYSASQLKRWQVLYEEVPEALVNPIKAFEFKSNEVQEGENIFMKVAIQNISDIDMDSMLVRFWLVDKNRVIHEIKKSRYRALAAHDTIQVSVTFSTLGYDGANSLWMEANPINSVSGQFDQIEQYHFNNYLQKDFLTNKDKANPLLDVTFDGVHILDGDLVSAKPAISIQLKDESKFLALDSENLFKVFLRSPNQSADVLIPFDGSTLQFIPANLPNNKCRVEFQPNLSTDGKYTLIVQAKDKSNNLSGAIDYRINFEVFNKSSVTEVMNYPNPFSTATHFVFTLTGSVLPDNIRIQIMSSSGRIVREIFQDELGPLHIGRNITQYAWDGKDAFGDQLANGVYFYRTVIRLNGENMERKETAADDFFTKGWGKMYLLR